MKKNSAIEPKNLFKTIVKYVIELLIVAFGVFLGVYLGEQKEHKKNEINTYNAYTEIISELKINATRLEAAINYHEKIALELDSATSLLSREDYELEYLFNKEKFSFTKIPSWQGFKTAGLSKTYYESARISGIFQDLNINTTQLIANIYEAQENYLDYSKQSLNKLLNMDSDTKIIDVVGQLQHLSKFDIYQTEKYLLNNITNTVEELEKLKATKTYRK